MKANGKRMCNMGRGSFGKEMEDGGWEGGKMGSFYDIFSISFRITNMSFMI